MIAEGDVEDVDAVVFFGVVAANEEGVGVMAHFWVVWEKGWDWRGE